MIISTFSDSREPLLLDFLRRRSGDPRNDAGQKPLHNQIWPSHYWAESHRCRSSNLNFRVHLTMRWMNKVCHNCWFWACPFCLIKFRIIERLLTLRVRNLDKRRKNVVQQRFFTFVLISQRSQISLTPLVEMLRTPPNVRIVRSYKESDALMKFFKTVSNSMWNKWFHSKKSTARDPSASKSRKGQKQHQNGPWWCAGDGAERVSLPRVGNQKPGCCLHSG